uniref:Glutaredoxin domain-containing protein n=1 Tax=Lotharella oceanica TaxID=641309 RepID=A0A7S2TGC9_9EUKA|mmetsp:Transcript_12941/g.24742  ORF Transcript_12941/g.24742 Transcript_12941/m.24742 type:complete len:208 (+) Transcript_12941:3-626(+)
MGMAPTRAIGTLLLLAATLVVLFSRGSPKPSYLGSGTSIMGGTETVPMPLGRKTLSDYDQEALARMKQRYQALREEASISGKQSRLDIRYPGKLEHMKIYMTRQTKLRARAMQDTILGDVKDNNVMIYSKSYCPFCVKVKDLFQKMGVEAKVIELDEQGSGDMESTLKELTQQRTVPQVFVKGKFIGGCDDTMAAYDAGKLQELLDS